VYLSQQVLAQVGAHLREPLADALDHEPLMAQHAHLDLDPQVGVVAVAHVEYSHPGAHLPGDHAEPHHGQAALVAAQVHAAAKPRVPVLRLVMARAHPRYHQAHPATQAQMPDPLPRGEVLPPLLF
jgi:hypothetical protein